ncbi:MAG TPA: redoxin domain-containing protein [Solirubrobacteraceae bacterium]|jgi:peroxiredoxin|nr:redoxin domain-containing protein [Solirubrobacteraceae bacterium]
MSTLPAVLRTGFALIALAVAMTGCGGSTPSAEERFDGAAFPAGVRAADFTLPNLSGRPVSLSAHRGHVVALTFLPDGDCRSCRLVAEQIRGALDELGDSARVQTVFVGPPSRSQATRFLSKTGLLGRASYLTADEARLRPVWAAYHVTPPRDRAAAEDAITVLLIDKGGLERVGFGIEQITPESLSHDIRLLEAG